MLPTLALSYTDDSGAGASPGLETAGLGASDWLCCMVIASSSHCLLLKWFRKKLYYLWLDMGLVEKEELRINLSEIMRYWRRMLVLRCLWKWEAFIIYQDIALRSTWRVNSRPSSAPLSSSTTLCCRKELDASTPLWAACLMHYITYQCGRKTRVASTWSSWDSGQAGPIIPGLRLSQYLASTSREEKKKRRLEAEMLLWLRFWQTGMLFAWALCLRQYLIGRVVRVHQRHKGKKQRWG